MAWKKQPPKDTAVEEIDLSAIDIDTLPIPVETQSKPTQKESKWSKEILTKEEDDFASDPEVAETTDEFDDDFEDDFDFEEEASQEEKADDGYVWPKDFFTDKRRKKNLKKFNLP